MPIRRRCGFAGFLLMALSAVATPAWAQCTATQLCAPGADPCAVTTACTVPAGAVFDVRPRTFVIREGKTLTVGAGIDALTILAGRIVMEKGAKIVAAGTSGTFGNGGAVILVSSSTVEIASMGNTVSKIDVAGAFAGGTIDVIATGDVGIAAELNASTASLDGFGGQVTIVSDTGSVTLGGQGIKTRGGGRGENGASGGGVDVSAQRNIVVDTDIDSSGGDCVCEIALDALDGDVTVTAAADLDLQAAGQIGDGGTLSISAGGNVVYAGRLTATARGSGGEEGDGAGTAGDLDVLAGGTVSFSGRADLSGAGPDGDGGAVDVQADGAITVAAGSVIKAPTDGFGAGGDVSLDAEGDLSLAGEVDVRARDVGGSVLLVAGGKASVSSAVTAKATGTSVTAGGTAFTGGNVTVQGCSVDVTATAVLDASGPGPLPGSNVLASSNGMTVRGKLLAGATGVNRLEYLPGTPPPQVLAPAVTTPPAQIVTNPQLRCCVACARCGDGNVTTGEQCDDGNTVGGDCCSAACAIEPVGTPCRAAAGACDVPEQCDGVSPSCPADAFRSSATVCRSAAGVCDAAEQCTGTGPACPADAKSTAVCRPAAVGAACDVAERCDGVGNGCPPDGFVAAGTVCRAAAGDCDVAETCTGAGPACPTDAKRTDVCRAATGVCDVAETCTGVDDACPPDVGAPDGTACGEACSMGGTCDAGACAGATPLVCGACEACDPVAGGCVAAPRTDCRQPIAARAAQLTLKRPAKGPAGDQLVWKWSKGAATTFADFGDPLAADGFALCVFERSATAPALLFRADVAPGGVCGPKPCWTASPGKGFRYANKTGNPSGITALALTAGIAGKAKIQMTGKGTGLGGRPFGIPDPPLALPLTVQIQSTAGQCWEAGYTAAGKPKNQPGQFNGKSDLGG